MKTMTSVEFRKGYAKLTEAAEVTANGRSIGYWYPAFASGVVMHEGRMVAVEDIEDAPHLAAVVARLIDQTPQAKRDAILRKINGG